jgi:3-deoxy-7-phosphoheptulonate synthase
MSRAAIAAGADGLMIEIHPDPKSALSDGSQSLTFDALDSLIKEIANIANVIGREW